jgi:hypothetical protein
MTSMESTSATSTEIVRRQLIGCHGVTGQAREKLALPYSFHVTYMTLFRKKLGDVDNGCWSPVVTQGWKSSAAGILKRGVVGC